MEAEAVFRLFSYVAYLRITGIILIIQGIKGNEAH